MKRLALYIILGGLLLSLGSCSDHRKPSIVFMPNMYYPVAYDPYMDATFMYPTNRAKSDVPLFADNHNITALWPAEGTVPRTELALLPYEYRNTVADYRRSIEITHSPLNPADRESDMARGEKLYKQVCTTCHGDTGNGQGPIVQSTAYSGVPTYDEREISVGSVYHVIEYGLNNMGSYSSQLTPADRWRVAEYVMTLKNNN